SNAGAVTPTRAGPANCSRMGRSARSSSRWTTPAWAAAASKLARNSLMESSRLEGPGVATCSGEVTASLGLDVRPPSVGDVMDRVHEEQVLHVGELLEDRRRERGTAIRGDVVS